MSISNFEQSKYDQEYYIYHLELLNAFIAQIKLLPPFSEENPSTDDLEFLSTLNELITNTQGDTWRETGQTLLCRIVGGYSHLMPLLQRDLLWFFGGDCLHYMPDEEIEIFQQLDEMREIAKSEEAPFDYKEARAKTMGLH